MEIKKYKGYVIFYDQEKNLFEAEIQTGEVVASNAELKILEKMLDKIITDGFKKIKTYYWDGEILKSVTITSKNSQEKYVWLIFEDGRRMKERLRWKSDLLKPSEKNQAIIKEMLDLTQQLLKIRKDLEDLSKKAECLSTKDFGMEEE